MKKNYTLITLTCMTIAYATNSKAQTVTTVATGLSNPYGIAAGKMDTLYVFDQPTFSIERSHQRDR